MKKRNVHVAILSILTAGALAVHAAGCGVGNEENVQANKVVELNRPFFYMIMDNETGVPVFMGIVTDLAE